MEELIAIQQNLPNTQSTDLLPSFNHKYDGGKRLNFSFTSSPNFLANLFSSSLSVPVIDYENERDNWCRILNSIHLITAPLTILYVTGMYEHVIESWIFIAIVTATSCLAALIVFLATSNKQAPRFHHLYGFLGFVVSMLWIYALATETVCQLGAIEHQPV